jgi:hypothetical protein
MGEIIIMINRLSLCGAKYYAKSYKNKAYGCLDSSNLISLSHSDFNCKKRDDHTSTAKVVDLQSDVQNPRKGQVLITDFDVKISDTDNW